MRHAPSAPNNVPSRVSSSDLLLDSEVDLVPNVPLDLPLDLVPNVPQIVPLDLLLDSEVDPVPNVPVGLVRGLPSNLICRPIGHAPTSSNDNPCIMAATAGLQNTGHNVPVYAFGTQRQPR